jgi:hypothetical protein
MIDALSEEQQKVEQLQKKNEAQKKTQLNQINSANDVIKRQSEQMKALIDLMKTTEETAKLAKESLTASKKPALDKKSAETKD